jgi:hypothetical protein
LDLQAPVDYYAPHLADEVKELIASKGHCDLVKGGGTTPWVAVLDTHYHALVDREYRQAEQNDMLVQLRRSRRLPVSSRQAVLYRANDSWQLLNHERLAEKSWKNDGICNALDGTEDHLIRRQCMPFWIELRMHEIRQQLI